MPVNPDLVGHEFEPTAAYLVGREKVREFARATFAEAPEHVDVEAARALGFADVVAPPTFAMVIQDLTIQQLLNAPNSGIALQNLVHAEQKFSYTRQIVAGDELTASLRVTNLRTVGGATLISSETDIVDATGAHVVTAYSTLLAGEASA